MNLHGLLLLMALSPGGADYGRARSGEQILIDSAITTEVKASLLAGNDACCLEVEVRTRRGTVRLYGFVDAQWQADKAVRVASAVSGVRHVTNDLTRKP